VIIVVLKGLRRGTFHFPLCDHCKKYFCPGRDFFVVGFFGPREPESQQIVYSLKVNIDEL
jgi:hypothetical protein